MWFNDKNDEEIYDLNLFVNWIETPGESYLALITDHPALGAERWGGFFSPREKEEGRLKSAPAAFRSWFLGRLAAKAAAARLLGLSPGRAEILKGPQGRPRLRGDGEISISHTNGAAAAVAGRELVGLDLELSDRPMSERVCRWAFTERELKLAEAATEASNPLIEAFWPGHLALWCAREAGAKAWGRGLLNHLNQVRVGEADWPAGRLRVEWTGPEPKWIWVKLIRAGEYLLALASGGKAARRE